MVPNSAVPPQLACCFLERGNGEMAGRGTANSPSATTLSISLYVQSIIEVMLEISVACASVSWKHSLMPVMHI